MATSNAPVTVNDVGAIIQVTATSDGKMWFFRPTKWQSTPSGRPMVDISTDDVNSLMDNVATPRVWESDVNGYYCWTAIYPLLGFPLHYGVSNLTSSCSPWSRDFIEVLWAPMEHSKHPKWKKTLLPILYQWAWSRARAKPWGCFFLSLFSLNQYKTIRKPEKELIECPMKFHEAFMAIFATSR